MRLEDVRRRIGGSGGAEYEAAYAEAERAERLGEAAYRLRAAAGLSQAELAARMGVVEDQVARAEEGDPALGSDFFDRLVRALAGDPDPDDPDPDDPDRDDPDRHDPDRHDPDRDDPDRDDPDRDDPGPRS